MRILVSILLMLLLVPTWAGESRIPRFGAHARLTATPLGLPAGMHNGRLTYLAGWELDSNDAAFGGYGAIFVDGDRFTLLSDGGSIVSFTLSNAGRISAPRFGALPDGPGAGWRKEDRDSESMAVDPASGDAWVGFEPSEGQRGAIWRYSDGFSRATGSAQPNAMRDWPVNGGAESLVRLRTGGFVVLSEKSLVRRTRRYRAIAYRSDPTQGVQRGFGFFYKPPVPRFRPTDAAELPDGDLIVVNRAVSLESWLRGNVAIVRREDIRPGATARGVLVGRIAPPLPQDNYEGIAVTREGGATILWIVSDDNESILQRTLLLKFRLEAPERGGR